MGTSFSKKQKTISPSVRHSFHVFLVGVFAFCFSFRICGNCFIIFFPLPSCGLDGCLKARDYLVLRLQMIVMLLLWPIDIDLAAAIMYSSL